MSSISWRKLPEQGGIGNEGGSRSRPCTDDSGSGDPPPRERLARWERVRKPKDRTGSRNPEASGLERGLISPISLSRNTRKARHSGSCGQEGIILAGSSRQIYLSRDHFWRAWLRGRTEPARHDGVDPIAQMS